jgi:hypothetical protein
VRLQVGEVRFDQWFCKVEAAGGGTEIWRYVGYLTDPVGI